MPDPQVWYSCSRPDGFPGTAGTCKLCGTAIVFDPKGFAAARALYPDVQLVCESCMYIVSKEAFFTTSREILYGTD